MDIDWTNIIASTPFAGIALWFARELLARFDKALDKVDLGFTLIDKNMHNLSGQIVNDIGDKHRETTATLQRIEEQISMRGKLPDG